MNAIRRPRRFRTIWLSDIHLGTKGCKAGMLNDFLRHHDSDRLYLVGDIFDIWRLKKSWYWTEAQNEVVHRFLRKAHAGTEIVFIPGNHDESVRPYCGTEFGNIKVVRDAVHVAADGRRLLVIHGDEFDAVVKYARWLAALGDTAYHLAVVTNHWFNEVRQRLGYPYWSLSAYLKNKVKNAVEFVTNFEHALVDEARRRGLDGVVSGHVHQAAIREVDGILYCNNGDWVESCTALVEHADGRLEIVRWAQEHEGLRLPELAIAS